MNHILMIHSSRYERWNMSPNLQRFSQQFAQMMHFPPRWCFQWIFKSMFSPKISDSHYAAGPRPLCPPPCQPKGTQVLAWDSGERLCPYPCTHWKKCALCVIPLIIPNPGDAWGEQSKTIPPMGILIYVLPGKNKEINPPKTVWWAERKQTQWGKGYACLHPSHSMRSQYSHCLFQLQAGLISSHSVCPFLLLFWKGHQSCFHREKALTQHPVHLFRVIPIQPMHALPVECLRSDQRGVHV